MAGLISNAMDQNKGGVQLPPGTLAVAGSAGYDPEQRSIDVAKETVSGQLDALLKSGSPYLDRARAGAEQYANKRGLLNSSIAAGAGEGAAIDAALPIANADANVYGTAARDNQAARNNALNFNADSSNKAALYNAEASNKAQMAHIEGSYKTLIQSSDSAGKLYQQAVDAINKTLTSDNLEPAAKDAAVARQTELLRIGLGMIGKIGDIDLASLLDFSDVNTGTTEGGTTGAASSTTESSTASTFPIRWPSRENREVTD